MTTPNAAPPAATTPMPRQIVVVSHSTMFYWWPVWVAGFVMALITLFNHELLATVPRETKLRSQATGTLQVGTEPFVISDQDVLVAPAKARLDQPHLQMTPNKSLGVIFVIILLLVVVITNVPLRGLWSVIVIVILVLGTIILALMGIWDEIVETLSLLDIRINLGGYLFISTVLLIMWLVVFFFFDRQVYMVFTPGSLRVQLEIGSGETAYDTTGMTIQKQRNDLFRHWILGLGSGDLIVTTAGAQQHHFDLPNVLSLGRRVREIEELLRTRQVVAAPAGK